MRTLRENLPRLFARSEQNPVNRRAGVDNMLFNEKRRAVVPRKTYAGSELPEELGEENLRHLRRFKEPCLSLNRAPVDILGALRQGCVLREGGRPP